MSLQAGKLPAPLLRKLLESIPHGDRRVLAGPGIGRDAAVIEFGNRMLVATSDPVTFATEDIGWYAVHVNANDIACLGARPAWFMATVLLPETSGDELARSIFHQLTRACRELGIELVGGHTEVTAGLTSPIVAGAMLGEAEADEIVGRDAIVPGDQILLAGSIAIEGTALLARELGDVLAQRGVPSATIERARGLLFDPGISVVRFSQELCAVVRPRLMHDPTEGGLATALYEMSEAGQVRLCVDAGRVPVLDETREICAALGLDPLGLLASGALLAIAGTSDAVRIGARLGASGTWTRIGIVEEGAAGVIMATEDLATPFPVFERDELARLFEGGSEDNDATLGQSPEG